MMISDSLTMPACVKEQLVTTRQHSFYDNGFSGGNADTPNKHKGREMAMLWLYTYTVQCKILTEEILTNSDSSKISQDGWSLTFTIHL